MTSVAFLNSWVCRAGEVTRCKCFSADARGFGCREPGVVEADGDDPPPVELGLQQPGEILFDSLREPVEGEVGLPLRGHGSDHPIGCGHCGQGVQEGPWRGVDHDDAELLLQPGQLLAQAGDQRLIVEAAPPLGPGWRAATLTRGTEALSVAASTAQTRPDKHLGGRVTQL